MNWRIAWAGAAGLFGAHAAYAEPVRYEDALRAAGNGQPAKKLPP